MKADSRILWILAARSGSKAIPGKNIKLLGGLPLLAYRILSTLSHFKKEDLWISTDSQEYADIAKSFSAQVKFLRPQELATDTAQSKDVILHAMNWAEENECSYDAVGLLEPTSPFISGTLLSQAAHDLFLNQDADSIVATRTVHPSSYYVQKKSMYLSELADRIQKHGILRRQQEDEEVTPSGGFYISKWKNFRKNQTFYTKNTLSFLVPRISGLEIDEPIDWAWAEFVLKEGYITQKEIFS